MFIIRGKNYYPSDIEETVLSVSKLAFRPNSCAVFSRNVDHESEIAIVQEIRAKYLRSVLENNEISLEQLVEITKKKIVQHHQIKVSEILFIKQGSLPKTENGKIQRGKCRDYFLNKKLPVAI